MQELGYSHADLLVDIVGVSPLGTLLENETVPLEYFDAMSNNNVIVFCSFVAMVHNAHLVGLHPPLPRPHRSTPPPPTPWGSTGTYV